MTTKCTYCEKKIADKLAYWDSLHNKPFCSMRCFLAYPFGKNALVEAGAVKLKKVKGGKRK